MCAAQAMQVHKHRQETRLADDIDRASAREAEMLADALRHQARRAGLAGKTTADSAEYCTTCGHDIPAQRRAAVPGCQRCVACQAQQEKKGMR